MANDSKRVSQLGITTAVTANDRVVVVTNPGTVSANTQTITLTNFVNAFASNVFPVANTTVRGSVKVDGISILAAANGMISAKTGDIRFQNNTITLSNTAEPIYILSPNNNVLINAQQLAQIAATQVAANNAESGNSQAYVWAYQGGDYYSEIGMQLSNRVSSENTNTVSTETYLRANGNFIFNSSQGGVGGLPYKIIINEAATYSLDENGVLALPPSGKIVFNTNPNQYIEGNMQMRIHSSDGIKSSVSTEANNSFTEIYHNLDSWEVFPEDDHSGSYPAWTWIKAELPNANTPKVFIENKRGDTGVEHRWTFDNNGVLNLPANGHVKGSVLISNTNNIYDELFRPLLNPNALDINADGGTTSTVFGPSDTVFDGGAVGTVFSIYEAALDGGVSFNNKHSASYIDGGGANQL